MYWTDILSNCFKLLSIDHYFIRTFDDHTILKVIDFNIMSTCYTCIAT